MLSSIYCIMCYILFIIYYVLHSYYIYCIIYCISSVIYYIIYNMFCIIYYINVIVLYIVYDLLLFIYYLMCHILYIMCIFFQCNPLTRGCPDLTSASLILVWDHCNISYYVVFCVVILYATYYKL